MKDPIFTGSAVAIITPFTPDGVDLPALGRLIDFQLAAGTDALVICGTTGEAAAMTYTERMRTIEYAVQRVDRRIPVIAGTGSNCTENAVALSRDAIQAGVDGLLVVTPYYNKATQEGLLRHYRQIADTVDRPMILYNVRPTPTSTASRRPAAPCPWSRLPAAPARRTFSSGAAMMRTPPPSACWAGRGSSPWPPMWSPRRWSG